MEVYYDAIEDEILLSDVFKGTGVAIITKRWTMYAMPLNEKFPRHWIYIGEL